MSNIPFLVASDWNSFNSVLFYPSTSFSIVVNRVATRATASSIDSGNNNKPDKRALKIRFLVDETIRCKTHQSGGIKKRSFSQQLFFFSFNIIISIIIILHHFVWKRKKNVRKVRKMEERQENGPEAIQNTTWSAITWPTKQLTLNLTGLLEIESTRFWICQTRSISESIPKQLFVRNHCSSWPSRIDCVDRFLKRFFRELVNQHRLLVLFVIVTTYSESDHNFCV